MTIDIRSHVFHILKDIGEDTERNGLKDTPKRVSKSLTFLTKGYRENLDEIINGAIFDTSNEDMVVLKDIEFYSLCEHHLLPFFGTCHIAYLPKGHVIGLSKIARIVDHFARRLQIQETLTLQIAEALQHYLQTDDVGVIMNAQHMCMSMRGINKQSASATTSAWLGEFKTNDRTRCEFMGRI